MAPGAAFVDAGGVEECFPTITGSPDHGDVWSRPWRQRGRQQSVRTGAFDLRRRIEVGRRVVVDYRLSGPVGVAFVWAFHALLDPAVGTRIRTSATPCTVWPSPGETVQTVWPQVLDRPDGDVLGPDDGSAVFCVLAGTDHLAVIRGDDPAAPRLKFRLTCPQAPVSFGIWRNLGGYPAGSPYRSFGIEPMLGRTPQLNGADPVETAHIPPSGTLRWRLVISSD